MIKYDDVFTLHSMINLNPFFFEVLRLKVYEILTSLESP